MCPVDSIRDAIINAAAVGLTLHTDQKLAYLVPRDGRCTLNISYLGLVRLAQNAGAIDDVRANTVHENDVFEFRGLDEKPEHRYNPFAKPEDRGQIVGVYCYVKTNIGHYLADVMSVDEIETVRQTSKAPNSPAWKKWCGEMAKKAVINRAAKLWPRPAQERPAPAIQVLNEHDGLADDQLTKIDTEHHAAAQVRAGRRSECRVRQPRTSADRGRVRGSGRVGSDPGTAADRRGAMHHHPQALDRQSRRERSVQGLRGRRLG